METNLSSYVPELLRLVRLRYPDWSHFSDAKFVADEIVYKRAAAEFAHEQLNRGALETLLRAGDMAGFIARLKSVANKTNLLYMGTPRKGDLAILNQSDADTEAICRAVFDLLHGAGDAADRLGAFCDFLSTNDLPQRWTFPTYFLFLLYPESELFVKPRIMSWLAKFTSGAIPYDARPSGANYAAIRAGFHALRDALQRQLAPAQQQNWLPGGQAELTLSHARPDMIDVQSFVYVAHDGDKAYEPLERAIEKLRPLLAQLSAHEDLLQVQAERDQVYERYGRGLFAPPNLPSLAAEDFASFLEFKNNRHWSGIDQNIPLVTSDMPALREALIALADETRPIAERYDHARRVKGLGKARITPFLLVTHPENYGVWNTKAEAGLRELEIFPSLGSRETEGEQYAAVNDVLLLLAEALEIDLWTLDVLWEVLARRKSLAAPFDAIFADRAQAEWAFDLFADAVERLGGGPDDPRFALTLRKGENRMRLNIGNSAVMDIADRGRAFNLTALKEPMENALSAPPWGAFSGESNKFGIFTIPIEQMQERREPFQGIYEQSMAEFGTVFSTWTNSNLLSSHVPQLFEALFDEEMRDKLLTHGLTQPTPQPRYWRITMPSDLSEDLSNDRGPYNLWAECLQRGVAAIDFDNDFQNPQVKKFTQIAPGDRVVAFLRNRTIGGIGVVTSPFDEETAREHPADRDFFRGGFWQRVGVDWTPQTISVDGLPKEVQNKFGTRTVLEISEAEFAEVEKLITPPPPPNAYRFADFLRHTHLTEARADELRAMVEDKRQAIFYGPPGTGKTYVAKHLARLLTGLADPPPDRLTVVQFHPAYGYEEFIEGIRPESVELDGRHHVTYPPRPGIFVEFCRAAERLGDAPCVFIIDEINRGNIPRIFGELMYLLEYRDKQDSIPLPYSARRFRIPPNVYLIGTMNTADRSIALVDFALRRRFHFAHFTADPDLFESWLKAHPSPVPWLGALYRRLTAEAVDDPDYAIGPSVFMRPGLDEDGLRHVWEWSVLPYLREYHIDRREAVEPWEWDSPQMRDLRRLAGAEPGADGDA